MIAIDHKGPLVSVTVLGEFTLATPGDSILIDDRRILHGVTEIHAIDPARAAWRDALVVTFVARD